MGHEVKFLSYPYSMSKSAICEACGDISEYNGDYRDRSGADINFGVRKSFFNSRQEAEEWIETNCNGFYEQVAVSYYDSTHIKPSKKLSSLKDKVNKAYNDYSKEISILFNANMKSEYYSCKGCNSKLRVSYLKTNYCPVCHNDLRSPTQLKKIERYEIKVNTLNEELKRLEKQEAEKNRNKGKPMWLVKIEYHV